MKKNTFINFEIGNACNLKCSFCYNDNSRKTRNFFVDLIKLKKKAIIYRKQVDTINLIGGEPLILPDFFGFLTFLYKLGYNIEIVTNGLRLSDEKFCKELNNYNVKKIKMSVHSIDPEVEDKITGGKGTLAKKHLGLANLKKYTDINMSLSMVTTKINFFNIEKYIDFYLQNYGITSFNIQTLLMGAEGYKNQSEIIISYTDIIKELNLIDKNKYAGIRIMIDRMPLCLHSKVKDPFYKIRELDGFRLNALNDIGKSQFLGKLQSNYIGDKCKKCSAFLKFCSGPSKVYINKFGYDEIQSLNRGTLFDLVKKNAKVNN